jgi:hypothetical protein
MNGECSDTGKRRYATARAAHVVLKQTYWGKRTKEQPRRVYYCKRCQGYHLTSNGDIWERRRRLHRTEKRGFER